MQTEITIVIVVIAFCICIGVAMAGDKDKKSTSYKSTSYKSPIPQPKKLRVHTLNYDSFCLKCGCLVRARERCKCSKF